MLNIIIFSKDRAMQLDLLLGSIKENTTFNTQNITVIYMSSTQDFEDGYNKLISGYDCNFVKETSFKQDVLNSLKNEYTMFLVDDDIFYRNIDLSIDEINNIFVASNCTCFSTRLGFNTNFCYTLQQENIVHEYFHLDHFYGIDIYNDIIYWYISNATNDYAYPFSLDGHIFKTKYIKSIIEKLDFYNPNTLEAKLSMESYSNMIISSFKKSCLVNTPVNRVQNTYENISGTLYDYNQTYLNELYLDSVKINLSKINFDNINGCHQELLLPLHAG
jgi:hypothetical protein